ncbi:MAG: hypothetical protein HY757_09545 [Nitrospirae bacterium]|nr:hypothetical protein [Nitrospirota bacterium]
MKRIFRNLTCSFFLIFIFSCASTPPQLSYLALEKPKNIIKTSEPTELREAFFRGGWYFGNYNFRPAPDIKAYIEQAEKDANTDILRNIDIQLSVPGAFDIFFFGWNGTTDYLTTNKQITKE